MRRLGPPQRRYSTGPSYPARGGDENAPPPDDGFDAAAPFTLGPKVPGAAASRRASFHFSAVRPPLAAASSSRYNGKPQLPPPTPKNGSGVRAAWNAPARRLSAATTSSPAPPPTKRLRKTSSAEILGSECVSVTPANLEGCPDEGFLSLELEWDIHKSILVEELKSSIKACRQKEAMICTLECNLSELIQESNELKKTNVESQELLKERDMEILRLNSELQKARKDQRDHVSSSSAKQEKDYLSSQAEFHAEVIASLATEQVSIKEQLAEIELLLDESIEATVQKEVIAQNYASLVMDMKEKIHRLESQLEQLKSCYKGTAKEPEIRMQEINKEKEVSGEDDSDLESQLEQSKSCYKGTAKESEIMMREMNDQVAASFISKNEEKEIMKTHDEENEILKRNKMLEVSIEDFMDTVDSLEERVYSLEKKAKKFEEEAQLQRLQREKLEGELHILRQQSLAVRSSGKAESSLKNGMADTADSNGVPSYRSNELLCSHESRRIYRKEVFDKESVVPGEDDSDLEILDDPPSCFIRKKRAVEPSKKKKRAVKVKGSIDHAFLRRSKRVAQKAEGFKDAESAGKFKEGKKEKMHKEPKKPRKPKDTKKGAEGGAEAADPIPVAMITPTGASCRLEVVSAALLSKDDLDE